MAATIAPHAPLAPGPDRGELFNDFEQGAPSLRFAEHAVTNPDQSVYTQLADDVEQYVNSQTPGHDIHVLTPEGSDIRGQGAAAFDKKLARLQRKPVEYRAVIDRAMTPTHPGESWAKLREQLPPPPPEPPLPAPERMSRRKDVRTTLGTFALSKMVKRKVAAGKTYLGL